MANLWPSGHFSASAVRPGRKKTNRDDHPLGGIEKDGILTVFQNRQLESPVKALIDQFNYFESIGQLDAAKKILDQIAAIPDVPDDLASRFLGESQKSPMGLSVVSYPRKVPIRRHGFDYWRGEKGISAYGRKMISSCCAVLENLIIRGCTAFLTVTTPTLSDEDLESLNLQWSTVQRRLIDEIKRELRRHGLPDHVICVTEVQEKRFSRWGQVCLHFHILFCGRHAGKDWAISKDWCRNVWQRILRNHGINSDCRSATRIEKLRKSAAKEMAKYLSKGGECLAAIKAAGKSRQLPTQWWYCSKFLKDEVKRQMHRVTGEQAGRILHNRKMLQDLGLCKFREVWMELSSASNDIDRHSAPSAPGRQVLMGIGGYFVHGVDAKLLMDACTDAEFIEAVNVNLSRLSASQGTLVSVCS